MIPKTAAYVPVVLFAAFLFTVLGVHLSRIPQSLALYRGDHVESFRSDGRSVTALDPAAESAGLKKGDVVKAWDGVPVEGPESFQSGINKLRAGTAVTATVEREDGDGQVVRTDVVVPPTKFVKDINHYLRIVVGLVFLYALPTFCVLLGLWVVAVRPRDLLAWLLLLILCGLAAISLEGNAGGRLITMFRAVFGSSWGLWMLLFGIYFPERWKFDVRFPWAKWILIVPLIFQLIVVLMAQFDSFAGTNVVSIVAPLTRNLSFIFMPLNLIAVAIFFIALGWKSGTLENKDARRRLRLMVVGCSVALLPTFFLILYILISRKTGSFFDIAPTWYALLSLFATALFPATLAYVIVVQRAMDVSVVVRQGIKYAFAKNSVLFMRIILTGIVLLAGFALVSNPGSNQSQKVSAIVVGVMLVLLIRSFADRLRLWTDRRFFREAYDTEHILMDLSENVSSIIETRPLLETVSTKLSESLHVPRVAMLLKGADGFQPAYAVGFDDTPRLSLSAAAPIAAKLDQNEPLFFYDKDKAESDPLTPQERTVVETLNAQLLLPLRSKTGVNGIISLGPKRSEEPYSPTDLRLLRSVASQTGMALENARLTEQIAREAAQKERLNRELEIAREVQERLFPQDLPKVKGVEYHGACRPALGVGGDYYDFLELNDGQLGLAIGDVSGKGIGAALMMASLQASLRGQTVHFGDDLAGLMVQVNRLVYDSSTTNRYATFFYGQYDPSSRKLIYVNAGHNPPVVLRGSSSADREVILLETGGPVVGMLPAMLVNYERGEITLEPGDILVGSTDGITEAMNPNDEEWGEDAMIETLRSLTAEPPQTIIEKLVAAADAFADGAPQHDDMTLIVLKVI